MGTSLLSYNNAMTNSPTLKGSAQSPLRGTNTLTVLAPGLFGPPGLRAADFANLNCVAVETLLARAAAEDIPAKGLEATLFHLFDVERDPAQDMPVAAVTRAADVGERSDAFWLRADPVHLRADQAHLILFDSQALKITQAEADSLVTEFNALFSPDGWHLEAPHPERWYLRLPEDPHIRTYDLREVLGRSIDGFLPSGARGRRWHTVLNEVQMLFHASPVNQARMARGAPPINSVWFWGGGYTPRAIPARWSHVWSNEPVATGLAHLAGIPHAAVPDSASHWLEHNPAPGAHLMVLDAAYSAALYGDVGAWGAALEQLVDNWFSPLLNTSKRRDINVLDILPADGRMYRITPSSLRRFWKRRRSLETYL